MVEPTQPPLPPRPPSHYHPAFIPVHAVSSVVEICGSVVTIITASQKCYLCRCAGVEHGSHDTSDQVTIMLQLV